MSRDKTISKFSNGEERKRNSLRREETRAIRELLLWRHEHPAAAGRDDLVAVEREHAHHMRVFCKFALEGVDVRAQRRHPIGVERVEQQGSLVRSHVRCGEVDPRWHAEVVARIAPENLNVLRFYPSIWWSVGLPGFKKVGAIYLLLRITK